MSTIKLTKPLTQRERLIKILSDGQWKTLFEMQAESRERFGAFDSETALSARWRELPKDGRFKRVRQGTSNTYEYMRAA